MDKEERLEHEDLHRRRQAPEGLCPCCGRWCRQLYTGRHSGMVLGCERCLIARWSDDVPPWQAECHTRGCPGPQPDLSERLYLDANGSPLGCAHCITAWAA